MSYAFQDEFRPCECCQYWLSNSSAGFWEMMQGEGVQLIIGLFHFHWAILGVPEFVGKL